MSKADKWIRWTLIGVVTIMTFVLVLSGSLIVSPVQAQSKALDCDHACGSSGGHACETGCDLCHSGGGHSDFNCLKH